VGMTLAFGAKLRRRDAAAPAAELVHELDARMSRLGAELTEELERTREESRRSRHLGELAWTIELDEVIRRTLDAAFELDGVDAPLITVVDSAGELVTRARGLSEAEAVQLSIEHPRSTRVQSMRIEYARGAGLEPPDSDRPVVTAEARPIEAAGR